ncbi:MAG TPA: histidinol-phosphate transaminase [Usitatibacteraceae bacterium]
MTAPKIIRSEIAQLSAYHVQPAAGVIKLDAMENPFSFPEALRAGLAEALSKAALNRYPSAAADELKDAIRGAMNIAPDLDILLGNGSDEIIQIIAMACAKPGAALLSVEPAFVMFKMIATFCGLEYIGVPLKADFSIDAEAMLAAIDSKCPALTFIAYPNNPTGNLFERNSIHRIIQACQKHGGLVVIDEAYFAFSRESFLHDIAQYPNAVLMRTVSKLGLAGARLGMLIGRRAWLEEFDKLRLPYNINVLTQAAATFAMRHYDALLQQAEILRAERTRLDVALDKIAGIKRFPSEANFVLIRAPDADKTFKTLLSRKILVKNTGKSHALMANTLRLTVGSPLENDALIAALTESP